MENILGKWEYNTEYNCYCMYGLVYTKNPLAKKYQCLNIFVPKSYINEDGTINENATCGNYNCNTAPIIFENNSARFSNMEPEALGSDRNYAPLYLKKGMVFISCGVRGRETKTEDGKCIGKIPANLIDVKTAIRFIKHYKQYIPGNTEQIISCGFSAGGAMSSLTGVSTDNAVFDTYLEENGAYMDESDSVFACMVYCPIIDLEHADMAFEWQFKADTNYKNRDYEEMTMSPFETALSDNLYKRFVKYFNSFEFSKNNQRLYMNEDGRSGPAYELFLKTIEDDITVYLKKHENPREYLKDENKSWISWDGKKAHIESIDDYVLNLRRRKRTCPSFDWIDYSGFENELFGNSQYDRIHFAPDIKEALEDLKNEFPKEYDRYHDEYSIINEESHLFNPLYFLKENKSVTAKYFRINVGSRDGETSHILSFMLYLMLLKKGGIDVEYNIIWEQPHMEADYVEDLLDWIERITWIN